MSIDVEDYFQVAAFERRVHRDEWHRYESRVERNTDVLLELLDGHDVRATFFILGWVAERYPRLIRRITDQGHEIANHSYYHSRITTQTESEFRQETRSAKRRIEDVAGCEVIGYRAPTYSISKDNLWALEVIAEEGHRYSSSIYPVKHDLYGIPEAPRFAFRWSPSGLVEIPVTTVSIWGRNMPCGGGGYFRLMPYGVTRWALRRVNRVEKQPAVFFIHPWEIDPQQPRQPGVNFKTRFRHYLNLHRVERRLGKLLRDFSWDRMDRVYLQGVDPRGRTQPDS